MGREQGGGEGGREGIPLPPPPSSRHSSRSGCAHRGAKGRVSQDRGVGTRAQRPQPQAQLGGELPAPAPAPFPAPASAPCARGTAVAQWVKFRVAFVRVFFFFFFFFSLPKRFVVERLGRICGVRLQNSMQLWF